MKHQIKHLAKITSGIYLKGKPSGDVFNLQARDVDEFYRFRKGLSPTAFSDAKVEKHYLHKGDVLVASKGNDFFAVVYNEEYSPAVASSIFLVIRNLDIHRVVPEYLSWYINHPKTQHFFKSVSKGTSLPTINKNYLASLEIPLPSIEKQKKIVLFDNLKVRRMRLP
ncbi:restriction endonuclease subunit S [Antarcticibacterium sp. 1MA-6-2]|uniref:restriction endonuclease subunit S n=1 Tax=Antarcticibacterium sp. 1MA-6-2 TaxID=2908210 RepID=UPI001F2E2EDA|nr:restriction endonuclease subunit S [Antarcticibacterium sp. 1MA-6-2]UJH90564.1 restriction endonuclease subunit S [Antarcticibacterium sp. 1MA-6-2]